ncbi:MAG: transposase [Bacteroidetes bacterium]|nr:transposase [Bacteroidota bacterium]
MTRRKIQFSADNYYHIYNRGNRKQRIFFEDENYDFFLRKLHKYFDPDGIEIISYCLMPNHYHLIVYLSKGTNFSAIMQKLTISYVRSINKWTSSAGHLFQSNYGALSIDDSAYLTHACRYIHLNPVIAQLVKEPHEWRYSDYSDWINSITSTKLPAHRVRDEYFSSGIEYKKFVLDYLNDKELDKKYLSELELLEDVQ